MSTEQIRKLREEHAAMLARLRVIEPRLAVSNTRVVELEELLERERRERDSLATLLEIERRMAPALKASGMDEAAGLLVERFGPFTAHEWGKRRGARDCYEALVAEAQKRRADIFRPLESSGR